MPPPIPDPKTEQVAVVVLAAGAGKRFKSELPKVLHRAAGLPLVHHVLNAAPSLADVERVLLVVGNGAAEVSAYASDHFPDTVYVHQTELLGTGDAVARCRDELAGFDGTILVLSGDSPLVTPETLHRMLDVHRRSGSAAT